MKNQIALVGVCIALLLTGCGTKPIEKNTEDKVSELTELAFLMNETNKEFVSELSKEKAEEFVYQMKDENYKLLVVDEEYGEISEGLTDDGNGKKVNCYKLPVTFSFIGSEKLVTDFLDSLKNRNAKIVMNRFDVTPHEEEYKVECIASFIGKSAKTEVGGISSSLSLVKNNKEVKEEEEIVLRDFDVNLTIRPSNSDAAAVAVSTEAGNSLYSDINSKITVKTDFYRDGTAYYCKYSIGDQTKTDKIVVGNDVKFDILSCKKKLDTDEISVDLTINNNLTIPVSVIVYNDSDSRVNITKLGSVEVNKK